MRILITGAFGNVGLSVIEEALKRGHEVTVFELKNKKTLKLQKKYQKRVKGVIFGDIRDKEGVKAALKDQDAVIHLAAILPPISEREKDHCFSVNVTGTGYIIDAIKQWGNKTTLIYTSSCSVMGHTQDRIPPVKVNDKVRPVDNYTRSKADAEECIRQGELDRFCITRLGAVMTSPQSYNMDMLTYGFGFPYKSRVEIILDIDVATALLNAAEFLPKNKQVNGKTFFLGGGDECRLYYGDFFTSLLSNIGIKNIGEECFAVNKPSFLDWLETKKAQEILKFQNHNFEDYLNMFKHRMRWFLPFTMLFGSLIGKILKKKSPYYRENAVGVRTT